MQLFTIKYVGILVIFSVDRSGSRLDPCEIRSGIRFLDDLGVHGKIYQDLGLLPIIHSGSRNDFEIVQL